MDLTETIRAEQLGAVLDLRPGSPFSIEDLEKAWLVLEGKLDLFLMEAPNGEPSGARHHLLRVEAGEAVLGFSSLADAGLALIASSVAESKVLGLSRGQLRHSGSFTIALIDKWIESLGSAAGRPAPQNFRRLQAGDTIVIEDAPAAALPLNGVVWVHHVGGSSTLVGDDEAPPLEQGSFFPVSRGAWLLCAPHTKVECFQSLDLAELGPYWPGLLNFQKQILACLVLQHRRRTESETRRLQSVAEADAALFEGALFKLAAPLTTQSQFRSEAETLFGAEVSAADPLLGVCQIVGRAAGVEIRPAPRTVARRRRQDPVAAIAEASRLRVRQVVLKGKWWIGESAPMVGFFGEEKRPVALLPRRRGYQLYDSVSRETRWLDEDLAHGLHGLAHVFYRPFPAKSLTIRDILAFGLRECRTDLATIALAGAGAGLLGIATPVLTGIIFDSVIPGADRSSLAALALFLVISAVATALFSLTRGLATLRLEGRMEAAIQAAVWDRLLGLPAPFFRNFSSGDLARRSLGISQIRQALTGSVLTSIVTGIFSVTACALMFYYSWRLALVATTLVAFSFVVFILCGYMQVRLLRGASELAGRVAGMTLQFINGIQKFRVAGTEVRAFAVWAQEFAKQRLIAMKARRISNVLAVFNSAFPVFASAAIFFFAASLMATNGSGAKALTTGEFLAFLAAFVQFSTGSLELGSAVLSVLNVVPLYERAKPILNTLPEVHGAKTDPGELSGSVNIHHVSFRYRRDIPLVLHDISVSIPAGQFVAFVGPSGSGKSTLFRLLLGFETPVSGAIYYDAQDLAELDVQAVRRQIGVVLQNARLTAGSIFDTIVGAGTLTIDDAWEAARMAGLDGDLKAMPMGMHTVISDGGGGLSGGQRQRLLIARAIVHKPRILLFDEATSALDNHTQAVVSQSLRGLNATRIVIAHRLSTVMQADRIYVLNRGALADSGTYNELMDKGGLFAELAKRQLS